MPRGRNGGGPTPGPSDGVETATLKRASCLQRTVRVTVSVAGDEVHELEVEDGEATYGDLLSAVGLSPQEAAVLVDGRPVPEDRTVDAERVEVLRLIEGG